ncbi:MAG: hypothetical protein ACRCUJ_02970 [Phocaeicola sp.]
MKTVIAILALIASYHTFKAYAYDVEMYDYQSDSYVTYDETVIEGAYLYPDGTLEFYGEDGEIIEGEL